MAALFALGGVVWLAFGHGFGVDRASAQPADALEGLVVEEGDLPLDATGRPDLAGIPGAREPRPLPADIRARLDDLTAAHERVKDALPRRVAPVAAPPAADAASAPPRMDAGDSNPDRRSIEAP